MSLQHARRRYLSFFAIKHFNQFPREHFHNGIEKFIIRLQEGCTALYLAASMGHQRIVDILLSCNADPNAENMVKSASHISLLFLCVQRIKSSNFEQVQYHHHYHILF